MTYARARVSSQPDRDGGRERKLRSLTGSIATGDLEIRSRLHHLSAPVPRQR
ncbi:hypothetical protein ALC60_10716 [Trachymyrmex zeteki]|uniref:Uncharacterized protein n=1 Tax=Mycetomoellerius zeteki TaxID=64791 RepID=A0A151WQS1_9HYME|nr:hypothetical protein ALC60_10716 [Trachymyrmex zeteki]